MGVIFQNGFSLGALPGTALFTLTSSDVTYLNERYGGYSNATSAGFTCDGDRDTWNGILYTMGGSLPTEVNAIWVANGLDPDDAYVWNINFSTGGNILARVALNADNFSNTIAIAPIDQTDTEWQSGNLGGSLLAGTYEFPAAFTLYSPTTQISTRNNWC